MASQLVQNQLSKPLSLNATNTQTLPAAPIPTTLPNPPPQTAFQAYHIGYNHLAGVQIMTQSIPARPKNGRGSAHTLQMVSLSNLHPILFQMEPEPGLLSAVDVPKLVDQATNQVEKGNDGNDLRYFSHLPRWVAHDVSGMLMELWMRLDPRVEMRDIINRVNVRPGGRIPRPSAFNMRRLRFRESINAPATTTGRQHPTASEIDMIFTQTREQLLLNTCMTVDLPNNRLLKPVLDNNRTLLGYVNSGLPMDYFLGGFPTPISIPSDRQMVVLELRKRMQTLAMAYGLGNAPQDYQNLPKELNPAWWHKEAEGRRKITEIDNKTHFEWIAEICQQYPGITRSGAQRTTRGRPRLAAQAQTLPPPVAPAPAALPPAAPPAPTPAIDARLMGDGVAALGVSPVSPRHYLNVEGGFSHYVEPAHRPE